MLTQCLSALYPLPLSCAVEFIDCLTSAWHLYWYWNLLQQLRQDSPPPPSAPAGSSASDLHSLLMQLIATPICCPCLLWLLPVLNAKLTAPSVGKMICPSVPPGPKHKAGLIVSLLELLLHALVDLYISILLLSSMYLLSVGCSTCQGWKAVWTSLASHWAACWGEDSEEGGEKYVKIIRSVMCVTYLEMSSSVNAVLEQGSNLLSMSRTWMQSCRQSLEFAQKWKHKEVVYNDYYYTSQYTWPNVSRMHHLPGIGIQRSIFRQLPVFPADRQHWQP